jgi:hypothetical protein
LFPWNHVPKESDEVFKSVTKYFFYILLTGGSVIGLFTLWVYLREKLDGIQVEETIAALRHTLSGWLEVATWWMSALVAVLLLGVLLFFGVIWMCKANYRKRAAAGVKYLRILPSHEIPLEIDKIMVLARTFGGMIRPWRLRWKYGTPWFRLRFAILPEENEIGIYLAYPHDKENHVRDVISSAYPHVEMHHLTAEQFPQPASVGAGGFFLAQRGKRKGLPLVSFAQSKQSQLGNILNCLRPGTFFDIQFAPVSWRKLEDRSEDVLDHLKQKRLKEMDPKEKAQKISLMKRLTGRELTFHVRLSLWSSHTKAVSVVRSTANAIETAMNYDGAIWFWKHDLQRLVTDRNPVPLPIPLSIMTWTCDELANLCHLPPSHHWIYQEPTQGGKTDSRGFILHLRENQHSLDADELKKGIRIGKMKHPLEEREIRVDYEQLAKHFLLTGASGMGKTSLAVDMVQSLLDDWFADPEKHPGFTIIDPAREIIPIIENRLRIAEQYGVLFPKEKVHHFNLSDDATHVPALNILHKIEGYPANQLAVRAATVLLAAEERDESLLRTERLMGMVIQSLLEDQAEHTILSIEDLLTQRGFRNKILNHVTDPYIKRFLVNFEDKELKRDLQSVLHRIDRLLQNPTLRRLFCQKGVSFDIRKYMDEGHLVFIDTFGLKDYDIQVTVGHLLNQYHQIAKKRSFHAKFHLVMMDEAQMVQLPLLTEILEEDRKYMWGLGLITRDIHQFKNEDLLQAIRSNIGMILSCGQVEGAAHVENLSRKYLKASFLEKLPERHAAVYLRYKRRQRSSVSTCVVESDPPTTYRPDGKEAQVMTNEKELAMNWGLEWGLEMMAQSPEVRSIRKVDREIAKYMSGLIRLEQKTN